MGYAYFNSENVNNHIEIYHAYLRMSCHKSTPYLNIEMTVHIDMGKTS